LKFVGVILLSAQIFSYNVYCLLFTDILKNAASVDYDQQVTDCMLSHPLSRSWPGVSAVSANHSLSCSAPVRSLSSLSERTRRLLGYVSPRKLGDSGVSPPRQHRSAVVANLRCDFRYSQ